MAYARFVAKGDRRERALLRHHSSEEIFGAQFAVIDPKEAIEAAKYAIKHGTSFIDINCGCPIEDTTRRGLGSSVLRKPEKIGALIEQFKKSIDTPITVKIRLGWSEDTLNFLETAKIIEQAGASAITVHGRTREQRYSKAANWEAIKKVKEELSIPVIGNGDVVTHFEAEDRFSDYKVDSLMIGRGALIKPWIFEEIKRKETLNFSIQERALIYYRLAIYMKEHFRDDEKGIGRMMQFLPWHFSFFHRYQYFPKSDYHLLSKQHPLMQSRIPNPYISDDPLEVVLGSDKDEVHKQIAQVLVFTEESSVIDALRKIPIFPEPTPVADPIHSA